MLLLWVTISFFHDTYYEEIYELKSPKCYHNDRNKGKWYILMLTCKVSVVFWIPLHDFDTVVTLQQQHAMEMAICKVWMDDDNELYSKSLSW